MNGIEIVIKNQKGSIRDSVIVFTCPICKNQRSVDIGCEETILTLQAIEKNNIIQMICEFCGNDIYYLNKRFRTRDFGIYKKAYEELGWISINPFKKIIRKIKMRYIKHLNI